MTFNHKYQLGQTVYLITDPDQNKHIITAIKICMTGELLYELVCKNDCFMHYEAEITDKRQVI
jgi:hypothetical protein